MTEDGADSERIKRRMGGREAGGRDGMGRMKKKDLAFLD